MVIGQVQNRRNELLIYNESQEYKIQFQQKEESEINKII